MNATAITIYSTPTCAYCHMAKEYLKGRGIVFKDVNITTDAEGFRWVVETTGQAAVPVLDIGGEVIVGFDRPRIDGALRDKRLA